MDEETTRDKPFCFADDPIARETKLRPADGEVITLVQQAAIPLKVALRKTFSLPSSALIGLLEKGREESRFAKIDLWSVDSSRRERRDFPQEPSTAAQSERQGTHRQRSRATTFDVAGPTSYSAGQPLERGSERGGGGGGKGGRRPSLLSFVVGGSIPSFPLSFEKRSLLTPVDSSLRSERAERSERRPLGGATGRAMLSPVKERWSEGGGTTESEGTEETPSVDERQQEEGKSEQVQTRRKPLFSRKKAGRPRRVTISTVDDAKAAGKRASFTSTSFEGAPFSAPVVVRVLRHRKDDPIARRFMRKVKWEWRRKTGHLLD